MSKKIKQKEFNKLADAWFVKNMKIAGTLAFLILACVIVGKMAWFLGLVLYETSKLAFTGYSFLLGMTIIFTAYYIIAEVNDKE